jgi:hypothetical protein
MAGYVRNDTTNQIADGVVINAAPLNGEFNALAAAFDGSTGHEHDGTSGDAPKINLTGAAAVTGTLPVANGGTGITSFGTGVATFLGTPSSANLAAAVTDETGSGKLVFDTSPTLVTPTLGVASATSINKVALTAPANAATLTIADGKTLTANNSLTFNGTDATTMTFPTTSATVARTDAAQTFTGNQTITGNVIFGTQTNKATLTYVTNTARTLTVPNVGGNRTFAFIDEAQTFSANQIFSGNVTVNGNTTLGDATSDTITATGRFNTDLVPSTDNARDLGTSALKWKDVYATTFTENAFPVVSQTDIGTAPNQIPLNQYLGSMAYLDADNISFSARGTNTAEQNLAVNKLTTVVISADTTLTTTVPKVGSTAFVIVITSGASSRTVTFGTGFKSTGTLATGTDADRRFVFQFISDGTNLVEVSRTTAITY